MTAIPNGAHTGCENCRKTERNLAQAIGIIERMADADRVLASLQSAVTGQTEIARQRRIEAARWLEEL